MAASVMRVLWGAGGPHRPGSDPRDRRPTQAQCLSLAVVVALGGSQRLRAPPGLRRVEGRPPPPPPDSRKLTELSELALVIGRGPDGSGSGWTLRAQPRSGSTERPNGRAPTWTATERHWGLSDDPLRLNASKINPVARALGRMDDNAADDRSDHGSLTLQGHVWRTPGSGNVLCLPHEL